MSDMRTIEYDDRKFDNAVALVGFPSVGLISSIVTSFMARELNMVPVAGLTSSDMPPYCLIQGGIAYPPIRLYACNGDSFCDDDMDEKISENKDTDSGTSFESTTEEPFEISKESIEKTLSKNTNSDTKPRNLVILTSEFTPKPDQCYSIATSVLNLLEKRGIKDIIVLDGIPRYSENTSMLLAVSSEGAGPMADLIGVKKLTEGLVRGTSGVMLYEAPNRGMNVVDILCPANTQVPDPRAAATLLEPLSHVFPQLKIDSTPLFKEAEEIEKKMKAQQTEENIDTHQLYG